MAKLKQRAVDTFFSPKYRKSPRVDRRLKGPDYDEDPDFSASSSGDDALARFKLEAKSQMLNLPQSPPRYILSSDDSDAAGPSSTSRPVRKLIRRSEASSSQQAASGSKLPKSSPVKSVTRVKWEGKDGKAVGKEKDISKSLAKEGKWSEDEDEKDTLDVLDEDDQDWLVQDEDEEKDVTRKPSSKGKGKAPASAARPSPTARTSSASVAPGNRSNIEDLLDAAVGSQQAPVELDDDSDGSVLIMETPTPEPIPPVAARKAPTPSRPTPGKSVVRRAPPKKRLAPPVASPSPSLSPQPVVTSSQRNRSGKSKAAPATADTEEEEAMSTAEEEEAPINKSRAKGKGKEVVKRGLPSKRRKRPLDSTDEDDFQGDSPRRPAAKKKPAPRKGRNRFSRQSPVSADEDEEEEAVSKDEEDRPARKSSQAGNGWEKASQSGRRRRPLDSTEEEDSDEAPRSKQKKTKKKLRHRRDDVSSDVTDDAPDDLEDEHGRLATLQTRMRSDKERASEKEVTRRKLLEKLKKKKQGKDVVDTEEESSEEEGAVDIWGRDANGRYAREHDSDFEREFIESDDQDVDKLDLPAAFRSDASQPMDANYAIACQWHVHAIIKGRQWAKKSSRDPYFKTPLSRLRDFVISTRNSGVTSQIWPSHFKKALGRYPEFQGVTIKGEGTPCDACRISSRPATKIIELSGKRYDPVTFKRISYDSEESEDEELKGMDSDFNVGRYCFARAHVYHRMTHFEDRLHEELIEIIEDLPEDDDDRPLTTTVRVAGQMHKIATLPSKNEPDTVIEWLNKKRWITTQWEQLKQLVDDCSTLDARFRGWEQ